MFKLSLVVILVAFAVIDARSHRVRREEPNLRAQARDVYENAKANFPEEEFKSFWSKLVENSGKTSDEVKAKFEANKGNMDLTIEQLMDKAQDKYPILSQQWNRVKSTWESKRSELESNRGESLSSLYEKARGMLESKFGDIDFDDFKDKISDYLAAINMNTGSRRFKREANLRDSYSEMRRTISQNFPKEEFKAFLSKLGEKAHITQNEIQTKLQANSGNMDLTLEELSSKLQDEYPTLTQQWSRIKNQWDSAADNMDETSLQDLYEKANSMYSSKYGNVDFASFYDKIKDYVAAVYARATGANSRVRREIPDEFKPHVREFQQKFGDRFPKSEWDAFYAKAEEAMKEVGMDINERLDKNNGDMDLTLDELKEKSLDRYPEIERKWSHVKGLMDNQIENMDETTVRDLFEFVRKHAQSMLGHPINQETMKDFVGNMKSYMSSFLRRLQDQGY